MSHYTYLPMRILKDMTGTEMQQNKMNGLRNAVAAALRENTLTKYEDLQSKIPRRHQKAVSLVSSLDPAKLKDLLYYPWFYECNRDRYPRWENKPDTRLGKLDR